MKGFGSIAIVVGLLLIFQACTQEPTIADKFLEYELLSEKEYEELESQGEANILNDPKAILGLIQNKLPRRYYSYTVLVDTSEGVPSDMIPVRIRCRKMAEGLRVARLISEEEYLALRTQINAFQILDREGVLSFADNYRYTEPIIGKEAMLKLAERWEKIGLLGEAAGKKLRALIEKDPKLAADSLPGLMSRTISFSANGWDIRQENDVRTIFDSLLTLVPEAKLTRLSFSIDTLPYEANTVPPVRLEIPVELGLNGRLYGDRLWVKFDYTDEPAYDPPPGIFPLYPSGLSSVLNQFLRESEISDRIVPLEPNRSVLDHHPDEKVWFVRLSRGQYEKAFVTGRQPWWVDDYLFFNELTHAQVDAMAEEMRTIGLLNHLSSEEFETANRTAYLRPCRDSSELLYALPDLVALVQTSFPAGQNFYPEIFNDLERISHSAFHPTGLKFEPVGKRGTAWSVEFGMNGKIYRDTLRYIYGEALDFEFVHVINQALSDSGEDRYFAYFDYVGDYISYIFINEKQEEFLRIWGVFPEYDPDNMDYD